MPTTEKIMIEMPRDVVRALDKLLEYTEHDEMKDYFGERPRVTSGSASAACSSGAPRCPEPPTPARCWRKRRSGMTIQRTTKPPKPQCCAAGAARATLVGVEIAGRRTRHV
jgi:hypothetical protein